MKAQTKASISKKEGMWRVSIGHGRDRVRRRFETRQEALDFARIERDRRALKEAEDLLNVKVLPTRPGSLELKAQSTITIEKALMKHRDIKRLEINDDYNFRAYRYILNYILEAFEAVGVTLVSAITLEKVHEVRTHWKNLKHSNDTINKRCGIMSSFFNSCVDFGYMEKNFLDRINNLPSQSGKRPLWSADQVVEIVKKMRDDIRPIFLFILSTGCRPIEATKMLIQDVDFERKTFTLRNKKNESKRNERLLPMTNELEKILSEVCQNRKPNELVFLNRHGRKILQVRISDEVRRVRRELGFPDGLVPYGLRHTMISKLNALRIQLPNIQEIAGHTDIKTTRGYIQVEQEPLRAALTLVQNERDRQKSG